MSQLRNLRVGPLLTGRRVETYTNEEIVEMLDRAEALGFDLSAIPSPLEDLTLGELAILVADAGTPT